MEGVGVACPWDGTSLKRIVYGYRGTNPAPLPDDAVYGYCLAGEATHRCPRCRREFRWRGGQLEPLPGPAASLVAWLRARMHQ